MPSIIDSSMKVFIECVSGFPCIWQVQLKDYKDLWIKEKLDSTVQQQQKQNVVVHVCREYIVHVVICSAKLLSQCVLCAMDARQTQYCEWYSASVFADACVSVLVSIQDARKMLVRVSYCEPGFRALTKIRCVQKVLVKCMKIVVYKICGFTVSTKPRL